MSASSLKSWANPIVNQQSCGSCTAFGTVSAWEGKIKIEKANPDLEIDLSEQDLFNCSAGTCANGDAMDDILDTAVKMGACIESCNPYAGVDRECGEGRCEDYTTKSYALKEWMPIVDVAQMKSLLANEPLVCTMMVPQSFMNYTGGVYHKLGTWDNYVGGHCMSVWGFDDTKGAWLVRNSWGTSWGEEGWCWIKYGDCEIDQIMYRLVPGEYVPPEPGPDPTPSPCAHGKGWAKVFSFFPWLFRRKGRFYYMNPPEKKCGCKGR